MPENFKDFIPWILGILSTIIALKKDWINQNILKKKNAIDLENEVEHLEHSTLKNVESSLNIFKDMLDTNSLYYKQRIAEVEESFTKANNRLIKEVQKLKNEIIDLKVFIKKQQAFLQKQSELLDWYEAKFGKRPINDNNPTD